MGRFLALLEAKIIEADPAAAQARRNAAAADRFVATGRSNEHGLKVLIAEADAGDIIWFLAMVNRIAVILAANGDPDTADVRRSKAIGILATPARALQLLTDYADKGGDPNQSTCGVTDQNEAADAEDVPVGEGDIHPSDNDADDPHPATCPTCAGAGTVTGRKAWFTKPNPVDPKKLLPPATLYVHVSQDSFTRDTKGVAGVARFEGVGPITLETAREFLRHTNVTIKPVIDLADQAPVDAYEVPHRIREAIHLRNPADIFPYAPNTGRRKDLDHTIPYRPPGDGGPPGQTHTGNLGPLTRFHHRIRTFGRWRLKQPQPGVYLWSSPHGSVYLVDHTGTHTLGDTTTAQALWTNAHVTAEGRATASVELTPAVDILEYRPDHQPAHAA